MLPVVHSVYDRGVPDTLKDASTRIGISLFRRLDKGGSKQGASVCKSRVVHLAISYAPDTSQLASEWTRHFLSR